MDRTQEIFPFWNKRILTPPVMTGFKLHHHSPERISANLAELFERILSVLNNMDLLHNDAALISRLLFRTKKTLRSHKGYKCLQKVRRCLSAYLSLDLLSSITNAREAAYGALAPCKEALEWCLLNLLRVSALFHRLQNTCLETAHHLHNHLTTGNNWHLAILFFACLSRVWTFSQYLVACTCEWYPQLKPFLQHLTVTDPWLPAGYELPTDLKTWLGNPAYIKDFKKNETIEEILAKSDENIMRQAGIVFNEDFGEIVKRKNLEAVEFETNKIRFQNERDIIIFLRNECNLRESESNLSVTQKLNEKEWKYLQNELRKCIKELKSEKNRKKNLQSLKQAQQKLDSLINKV